MLVLNDAVAVVQWRGVNEFTVIVGGLVLAFGSYLVSISFWLLMGVLEVIMVYIVFILISLKKSTFFQYY